MNDREEQIRGLCAQQASDWFVACRDGQLSHDDARAFGEWLLSAPQNVEEYLGVAAVARALPLAAHDPAWTVKAMVALTSTADDRQLRRLPAHVRAPTAATTPQTWSRRPLLAAAAVIFMAVAGALWWSRYFAAPIHYETGHGGQQTLRLPDSSVLQLNTDTSLTVRFDRGERRIVLDRGQAHFIVAHETSRPFRVVAGNADVIAVGTRFDVQRQRQAILVTVSEGHVTVGDTGTKARRVAVAAGEQLRVEAGQVLSAPVPVNVQNHMAWLRRQIVFDHAPLATVAAEFNRYSETPIAIESSALNGLRVSGVFSVDDLESFVAFLKNLRGVTVETTPMQIVVKGSRDKAPDVPGATR